MLLLSSALLLAAPTAAGEAAATPPPLPTGRLVEGLPARADPEMTYTLYLPPGYDGERRRPVLLIFDPRGRSVPAAERFVAGAERFGWIIVSSNDTRSDGPWDPNVRAVNALLPELDHYAVDPRRVYAAGFSGGAHLAWILALQSGALAGVIASGGRDSPAWMVDEIPFASFAAVGDEDFNYAGTLAVDRHFGSHGARHRMQVFPGPHGWMPAEMATDAMAWLEVVAMAEGRRPLDPRLVAERFRTELATARALAEEDDAPALLAAERRYDALLRTYGPLAEVEAVAAAGVDPAPARRELTALRGRKAFRVAEKQARRWDGTERTFQRRLASVVQRLEDVEQPMTAGRFLHELTIDRLLEQAEGDGYAATTARRMLASVYVQTSFYLSRDYLAAGRYRSAATVLEVATHIRPDRITPWYNLACARARMGHTAPALEALQRAVEAGYADLAHLRSDPDLESLHGEEGYRRIVQRLAQEGP